MRRLSPLILSIGLLWFCLAAFAGAGERAINGKIVDAGGAPLPDLSVTLFNRDGSVLAADNAMDASETDARGRFRVTPPESHVSGGFTGPFLLRISGNKGSGRVAVTAGEKLEITYPVRKKIVLLHDNDLHFNFNHLKPFRDRIEELRETHDDVFLLNAGDIFIRAPSRWPTPQSEDYFRRARFMIETMNDLGYDVMTAGNHELDYIGDYTRRALELADFSLLGGNIQIDTEALPELQPYTVLETKTGRTVAVLGLSVVNFEKAGVADKDPVETARKYHHLANDNDVWIALTHIGLRADRRLAKEIPEFDAIIGGHSHILLKEADRVNGVLVAQAGGSPAGHPVHESLPKYLGKVVLLLENGNVIEKRGHVEIFP